MGYTTTVKNGFVYYDGYNHYEYANLMHDLGAAGVPFDKIEMHRAGHIYQVKVSDSFPIVRWTDPSNNVELAVVTLDDAEDIPEKEDKSLEEVLDGMKVDEIRQLAADKGIVIDKRVKSKDAIIKDFLEKYSE